MKFFIPLGFRYGGVDGYSHVGSVYGPYDGLTAVDDALTRLFPNDQEMRVLVFDADIRKVPENPKELPEKKKRAPGDERNWTTNGANPPTWTCKTCDAVIMEAKVAHPIWLRGMSGGFGECKYESVGYCPNCETKPAFNGAPVYED